MRRLRSERELQKCFYTFLFLLKAVKNMRLSLDDWEDSDFEDEDDDWELEEEEEK